jgi:hypothetical protein
LRTRAPGPRWFDEPLPTGRPNTRADESEGFPVNSGASVGPT